MKRLLTPLLILTAVWLVLAGAFAGSFMLQGDMEPEDAVRLAFGIWGIWLALLPVAVWLTFRFPIERPAVIPRTLLHLAACALAVLLCQSWAQTRMPARRDQRMDPRLDDRGTRPPDAAWPGPGMQGRRPQGEWAPGEPVGQGRRGAGGGAGPGPGAGAGWPGGERPPGIEGRPPGAGRPGGPEGGPRAGIRIAFDVLLYWAAVCAGHAVLWFRRSVQRERHAAELQSSLTAARLDALRLQLNPHFLFNSLNAISTLVHTRPDAADEMIGSLSELLRFSLDSAREQEVPLQREMEVLRCYLDLEKTRFGPRLTVEEQIDPAVLGALVPTLCLQPLAENAVRHGIEPRPGPGCLRITARREEDALILALSDDGAGLAPDKSSGGIGIANTRARLRELYGDAASLTLESGAIRGCTVTLRLPFHTAPVAARIAAISE